MNVLVVTAETIVSKRLFGVYSRELYTMSVWQEGVGCLEAHAQHRWEAGGGLNESDFIAGLSSSGSYYGHSTHE